MAEGTAPCLTMGAPHVACPLYVHAARGLLLLGLTVNLVGMIAERGAEALPVEDAMRIERIQDPTFLQNDLGGVGLDYYGRAAWMQGLAWASRYVSVESLLLALYYVEILITLAGMYHLTLTLSAGDDLAAVLAVALLAVYPHPFMLGVSAIYGRHFYEAWLSAGILMFALSYAIQHRPWPALVIAGLSANLHLLQGVQMAVLIGLVLLLPLLRQRPWPRRELVALGGASLASLVLATPELVGVVAKVLSPAAGSAGHNRDLIEIVGHMRYGHHFLLAQNEIAQYLGTAIVVWLGLTAAWALARSPRKSVAAALILLLIAMCVLVAPLAEWHYVVMYLDMLRSVKFIWILAIALLASMVAPLLRHSAPVPVLLAAATVLLWHVPTLCGLAAVGLLVAAAVYYPADRWKLVFSAACGATLVGLSFHTLDLHRNILRWNGMFGCDSQLIYAAWVGGVALLAILSRRIRARRLLLAAVVPALATAALWLVLKPVSYTTPHPEQALLAWIRTSTPPDAVIVTPPTDLADFRYQAHRSVLAEMWIGPLQPNLALEWYDRLNVISGGELARQRPAIVATRWETGRLQLKRVLSESYRRLSAGDLRAIGQRYGVRYCVMYADVRLDLPVLFRGVGYNVLDLRG